MSVTLRAPDLPAGPRSALIIATSAYADDRLSALRAPARDAEDLVAVLGNPEFGGFTLTELRNKDVHSLRVTIDDFLSTRESEETVLVYLSCHGILTARRRLYFAASDTRYDRLAATGLDTRWLIECLDDCRARRQVVILDCCFSGAFALAKGSEDVGLDERFGDLEQQGRGRVVLTASRATEYSFEGTAAAQGDQRGSVFTSALVEGMRTGSADKDRDGLVSVSEAYAYAYGLIRRTGGSQTPQRWLFGGEGGDVVLTRSPAGHAVEPAALPDDLRASLDSRYPKVRVAALDELASWLRDPDPSRVVAALAAIEEMAAHDVPLVSRSAHAHLERSIAHSARLGIISTDRQASSAPPAVPARSAPAPAPAAKASSPSRPRLLGGWYELEGTVGRGGMAEVYRARDIRLDRIVAIKTLREDLARDQAFQTRFRREAQSAASLNHPSIVAVYDTDVDTSTGVPLPYIVTEFVDGRTVRDLLVQDRHWLTPERTLQIVGGVLRALDYSHQAGIVHGDIKPGNVMVTRAGDIKVMDFGIIPATNDPQATMMQAAQVLGTAQYLSPEQARGEQVDARSDLYSTGCLMYELLTGRPPFQGDSPIAIAYQHVRENPVPPSQVAPGLPQWADAITLKALAKSPGDRYQSASEMTADILRAAAGLPVAAVMQGRDQPPGQESQERGLFSRLSSKQEPTAPQAKLVRQQPVRQTRTKRSKG